MAFAGFGAQTLPFFKALAFHQNKEWYDANRDTYEGEIKEPLGDLVEALAARFAAQKIPLRGDRKASLFRLHRDVRFARDKSPYKTHAGAVMTREGTKSDPGLLYIHIAPEGCFFAAGVYHAEPQQLANLRHAIVRAPAVWTGTLKKLAKAKLTMSQDEILTRAPKGFERVADPALMGAIRLKSFIVTRPITAQRLAKPELCDDGVSFAKDALPLLEWAWSAIVDSR